MEFKFADVGEGIREGEIVRWHVSEGDSIKENETLVEVETDKAIVDIPCPCDGTIDSLPRREGDRIEVGEVLAVIDVEGKDVESTTVVGEIASEAEVLDEESEDRPDESEVLATPKTRNLARELGVELEDVEGTGKNGRITNEDVREAAESTDGEDDLEEYGSIETVPLKGVRKRIAEQTRKTHAEVPQVTHMDKIDVTELTKRIEALRDEGSELSFKLTLTPFLLKALTYALKEFPYLNSTFREDEIVLKKYYHIGVTVDTEDGLLVPVVRNADELSVLEAGREVARLADRARNRTIEREEMKGGSFTLTNIGFVGGTWSTPQVNYPQAAVLAAGRAEERPAVVDGEVTVRTILPVSLSFDHRILDGATAARFVNELKTHMRSPDNFELD
ncbi:MAG: dihydrolipoamide acetyltransferase family protein [bacterium]